MCMGDLDYIQESNMVVLTNENPCVFVASPGYQEGTAYPNEDATREYYWKSDQTEDFTVKYVEEFDVSNARQFDNLQQFV